MPPLTPAERRALRAEAHHLHPVVAIGAHGLTSAVLREIDVALKAHELVKIRVANGERDDRQAFLDTICRELDCAPVQHLGKLLIVWRMNPELHRDTQPERRAQRPARAKPDARRASKSPPARVASPSGEPRAPSRRRRGESAGFTERQDDQSRRRRRAR
jgi:putative YhbY family RNA-binding protein